MYFKLVVSWFCFHFLDEQVRSTERVITTMHLMEEAKRFIRTVQDTMFFILKATRIKDIKAIHLPTITSVHKVIPALKAMLIRH